MSKLLVLGAALLLLDVFPGGCNCAPSTTAGPCQTTCDCDQSRSAPIKCPGMWACSEKKQCEYACLELCLDDGGCATSGEVCGGSFCSNRPYCP